MTRRGGRPVEEGDDGVLRLWADESGDNADQVRPARTSVHRVPTSSSRPKKKRATDTVVCLDGLPLMLTVDEAAAVLRVSRTSAYKLVDEYRRSNGREGLPHVRLGGRVLIRRVDLAAIVGL